VDDTIMEGEMLHGSILQGQTCHNSLAC
jgi:hypothetical protein